MWSCLHELDWPVYLFLLNYQASLWREDHLGLVIAVFGVLFARALVINFVRKLMVFLILLLLELGVQVREGNAVFAKLVLNLTLLCLVLDTYAFM